MKPDLSNLKVGGHVIFVDPVAVQHDALVTAVWGDPANCVPCINVVCIEKDQSRTDSYGRQMARHTSVAHRSQTPAHGMYFMMPGDVPNPIVQAHST